MNSFERDKYLRFCEKSVLLTSSESTTAVRPNFISEFRYMMAFEPYHTTYLPIIQPLKPGCGSTITPRLKVLTARGGAGESLHDSPPAEKDIFFKTLCLNFDERTFLTLYTTTTTGKVCADNLIDSMSTTSSAFVNQSDLFSFRSGHKAPDGTNHLDLFAQKLRRYRNAYRVSCSPPLLRVDQNYIY